MRNFPSISEIVKVFEREPPRAFRLRELMAELGLRSSQARELKRALKDLLRAGKLVYLKKNQFALARRHSALRGERAEPSAGRAPASRRVTALRPEAGKRSVASGRLIGHRDGYGFVVPDQALGEGSRDIFVPPGALGGAMHGDRVEVHFVRSAKPARPGWGGPAPAQERLEGRVIRILDRAQKTVVGEFRCGPRHNTVLPYDHRLPFEIVIPSGQEWPSATSELRHRQFGGESEGRRGRVRADGRRAARELDGMIVDIELTQFPDPIRGTSPRGRVVEVLGLRDDFGVDVEIIIRKFHLPHRFPVEVLAEAEAAPQFIPERAREGRRDFRHLPIVTIDGETAKDFDDAVYVERAPGGGYVLQVHIADVAHYVRPGTALDREARLRGTSVYFPDRAVPMLPLELSNGICSLNPRAERLVMSVLMEIDAAGRVTAYELVPGIIRSAERMTYTAVHAVLSGDPAACERYAVMVERFKLMEELARALNRQREARGSIDFDLPEPEIEFDEHGRMVGVARSERNMAHRLIEEFMLAANESVADYLERQGVPTLYRVHEKPDPRKVLEFEEIAATFGYSLGVELPAARRVKVHRRDERERYPRFQQAVDAEDFEITSRHYQRLTQRIAGKPEERILSYLMLRSLKQARYAEENLGHFALASPAYTHFTSPIRRYPDLIVHRVLKAVLETEGGSGRVESHGKQPAQRARRAPRVFTEARSPAQAQGGGAATVEELHALGIETSEAERRAADAERELMEWKKVSFMAGRLGDEFEALIISLTKHGFFVELIDLFVEGFVPLAALGDDRYVYRESLRAIVGRGSNRAYRLGDRVRVRLDRIERAGNKLEFSLAE
ncbi:MAG TPA: VacB/RNase II family 3'-5' exoribonuclease [Terriglobia bacterium]|nr:VacB/RNase II family 3'-5' exoribonuclease [Terriglobia bacterium]